MSPLRQTLSLVLVVMSLGGLVTPAVAAIDADGFTVDPEDYDEQLQSSELFWAGQAVLFDGSEVVDDVDDAPASERTFQIRRVNDGDSAGTLTQEFVVDSDGERAIDTSGLQGYFVIMYQGDPVYVQDGVGYTVDPPDGTTVTVESSRWEVAQQTLSAAWSDSRVFRSQVVDLEITSNRAAYQLEVSGEGLDFEDLVSMFDDDDFADDHDAKADDDILILDASNDPAFPVGFADLENGRYTLKIEVADSDASTTTMIQLGRPSEPTPSVTPDLEITPTEVITRTPETTTAEPIQTTVPASTTMAPSPSEPTTTGASPSTTDSPGQPGFGMIVAGLGIVLALLVRYRR